MKNICHIYNLNVSWYVTQLSLVQISSETKAQGPACFQCFYWVKDLGLLLEERLFPQVDMQPSGPRAVCLWLLFFFPDGETNLIGKLIEGRYLWLEKPLLCVLRRGGLAALPGWPPCFNELCSPRHMVIWKEIFQKSQQSTSVMVLGSFPLTSETAPLPFIVSQNNHSNSA